VAVKKHRLQRTCLGCGARDDRGGMIRLAVTDQGGVVMETRHGRGGYLHQAEKCWKMFISRKNHFRAFRREISRAAKESLVQQLKDRDRE
jgi:predicted RNA-binding protein YlxR (DUF448 family)